MENFNHKLENLGWNDTLEIECDYCHNTFKRTKRFLSISEKRGSKLKFCNKKCFNDYFPAKLIKCICKECRQEFSRQPSELKRTKNYFCSSRCAGIFNNRERNKNKPKKVLIYISKKTGKPLGKKFTSIKCILNCLKCSKEIFKTKPEVKKSKHDMFFCSKSCRMTYQNLNNKTHNHPGRRSKAEHQLVNLLKSEFPNLIITENNRSVLPSKLELDIYIPEFKFAIELNGPVHYLPIFGSEKLLKAQNKDYIKNKECIDMKISLMTIDISRLNSIKKSKEFIIQTFEEKIKPLILDFLVAGDELNVPFAL